MATFREQLVLLLCERFNAEDVVERSTTRRFLDASATPSYKW